MAKTRILPGYGPVAETATQTRILPGYGPVAETAAVAPPAGAVMNQFQSGNVGADLYNGTIL